MDNSDQWVLLREAVSLLGMSKGNFRHYVTNGRVRSKPGRGKRDKRYNLADILMLKKEWKPRQYKRTKKKEDAITKEGILIDWLQPSDIPAGLRRDMLLYPDEIVEDLQEASVYQSWRKNNNLLTMGAFKEDRSECFAYLQLVSLEEQAILDILRKKRSETSIRPEEVLGYDRPGGYTLLGVSAVCHKDYPTLLFRIIERIMKFWEDQYPERYITRIYAQAVSESGDRLIQHLFMAPRYDLAQDAYMLDIARPSASKIIRNFQARLETKAPLPDELRHPYNL